MAPSSKSARIAVRLVPRASRDEVAGFEGDADDVLRVRVTAPPVEGRANAALTRLLAGQTSRRKVVAVDGLSLDEVRRRLA